MKDYPKGHVVAKVTIGGKTKRLCITCGNEGVGKGGELPKTVTKQMLSNALRHRLEHGKCKDCWPKGTGTPMPRQSLTGRG